MISAQTSDLALSVGPTLGPEHSPDLADLISLTATLPG